MENPFFKSGTTRTRFTHLLALTATALLLNGCVFMDHTGSRHRQSSTVEYLYPNKKEMAVRPSIPHLSLPLSVGIAFVPGREKKYDSFPLSEAKKMELMTVVAERFKGHAFISKIELIPSTYLVPGGGFRNLDQMQAMLGIDVIALIGYDQIQYTEEDFLALSYWTIVGAYLIRGEKNDTATMIDTSVFDIKSRKLLFRAPGTSQIAHRATPVNLGESLRKDAESGLSEANELMITNLERELTNFKVRVKKAPKEYKIVHKPGYTGGGSFGPVSGLVLAVFMVAAARRERTKSQ